MFEMNDYTSKKSAVKELENTITTVKDQEIDLKALTIVNLAYKRFFDDLISDHPDMLKGTIIVAAEATGSDLNNDEILRLSIISDEGEKLYDHTFRPTKHSKWDTAQTSSTITPEKVANCPPMYLEAENIVKIIQRAAVIIGYNTGFVLGLLDNSGIHYAKKSKIVDVMKLHSASYGEWDESVNGYRQFTLRECADHYGYDFGDEPQSSLSDCRAALFCYNEMRKREKP